MTLHIISPAHYTAWNEFLEEDLHTLCGVKVRHRSGLYSTHWTEKPCSTPPDKVCPACREDPEYAMILLSGEEVLY